MRHSHRQAAAFHALEEDAGRLQNLDLAQTRLIALAQVLRKARPVLRARNDVGQLGKHLAAIAHAQRKGVLPRKEGTKAVGQQRVKCDGTRPTDACAQRVAVAEAATSDHARKVFQIDAAVLQIRHVHIDGFKARQVKSVSHLHMRVHALLAQDGHAWAACVYRWRGL